MKNLKEALQQSQEHHVAIGHFNISDLATLRAVFDAAREYSQEGKSAWGAQVPILIGVSEGEREFIGVQRAADLVRSVREEYNYPIFINADHTHSLENVEAAARAGFDEILLDGSQLSFAENVKLTKQAVELAKSLHPEVVVEGEIGYIGSNSEVLQDTPEGAALSPESFTKPEEAKQFVDATKIDVLAPAVGNMHGLLASMVKGVTHKHLDIQRIQEIKNATGIFMTLHGGSGTQDTDFVAAVQAGMNIIHVSSELRVAWRRGMEASLQQQPNEIAPYKLIKPSYANIKEIVANRLRLYS